MKRYSIILALGTIMLFVLVIPTMAADRLQVSNIEEGNYDDATIKVPAPNVLIDWKAEIRGYDADMNLKVIFGGTFTGIDKNGVNQKYQFTTLFCAGCRE